MLKSGFESWLPSHHVRAPAHHFGMRRRPRYTRDEAAAAVRRSKSLSQALRELGLRPAGGNHRTFRRHLVEWGISTEHFDPAACQARAGRGRAVSLESILVEHSTFARGHLKERLYAAGVKSPRCELCGQGPRWCGREMALVLDHINGIADDNRIENLRIVCPNCAATLDTHCGRNARPPETQTCERCGERFHPRRSSQRTAASRAPDAPLRACRDPRRGRWSGHPVSVFSKRLRSTATAAPAAGTASRIRLFASGSVLIGPRQPTEPT
jgi:hypothetical protein